METTDKAFIEKLISVTPSARQLEWQKLEYYNIFHFNMSTFTGKEWETGKTPPSKFNPTKLSTDQWVASVKRSGSKGVILTVKHHDGFCLYDTKYTDYNVMNSPYGKDIVLELSKSCSHYGLKFGIYLSPWDRHEKTYGSPEYNDFFVNQLTELCENYGEIFSFWFGGTKDPKKEQVYDFPRYFEVIRKLQPNAVICIHGEDVRWIGNTDGASRSSEWSVVEKQDINSRPDDYAKKQDLGSREALIHANELVWYPAETDVSITNRWFWHLFDQIFSLKSVEMLSSVYYESVGANSSLLLNVPINRKGLVPKSIALRLENFGDKISSEFKNQIATRETREDETYTMRFESARLSGVVLQEDITKSQRIENFVITAEVNGQEIELYEGRTVGHKKICRFTPIFTDTAKVKILSSRDKSFLLPIKLYN